MGGKAERKQFSIRVDHPTLEKVRYISGYEDCSINRQIIRWIYKGVREFENKNGKIQLE